MRYLTLLALSVTSLSAQAVSITYSGTITSGPGGNVDPTLLGYTVGQQVSITYLLRNDSLARLSGNGSDNYWETNSSSNSVVTAISGTGLSGSYIHGVGGPMFNFNEASSFAEIWINSNGPSTGLTTPNGMIVTTFSGWAGNIPFGLSLPTNEVENLSDYLRGSLGTYNYTSGVWRAYISGRQEGTFSGFNAYYDVSSVTLAIPIPEPSTYGLILGGLAFAGAAMRRRKKA